MTVYRLKGGIDYRRYRRIDARQLPPADFEDLLVDCRRADTGRHRRAIARAAAIPPRTILGPALMMSPTSSKF